MTSIFRFETIDEIDLDIVINEINPKSSCGYDDISSKMLKKIYPSIKVPLLQLINQSLQCGIFPEELKLAKIVPIYKNKEDKNKMCNYRPISLLSSFSKVFEKVVYR